MDENKEDQVQALKEELQQDQEQKQKQNSFIVGCGEVVDDVIEVVGDIAGACVDGIGSTAEFAGDCASGVLECIGSVLGGLSDWEIINILV